jgi:DNA polymerase I-like protein with 3'-5' exonuclease and polymerase domains
MDRDGLQVVMHIHDEIVVECKESEAEAVQRRMEEIMTTPPSWAAAGLPLAAEGGVANRFAK